MERSLVDRLRPLAGPVYCTAWLLVLITVMDFALAVWPFQPGAIAWRYGAGGLLGGYLLSPILGVAMIALLARALDHRRMLWTVVALGLIGGLVLVITMVAFPLDAVQLRGRVEEAERWAFDVGVAKALVKHLTGGVALLWLAGGSFRALRSDPKESGRRQRGTPLMVGGESKV